MALTSEPSISIPQIITLSADSSEELEKAIDNLSTFLKQETPVSFRQVCETFNRKAGQRSHRFAVVGRSPQEITRNIRAQNYYKGSIDEGETPKLCMLFSGFGSAGHNMGRQLYENIPIFRETFDKANAYCLKVDEKVNLKAALYGPNPALLETSTLFQNICPMAVFFSLQRLWKAWGIQADIFLSHSYGEYVAAVAAGVHVLEEVMTFPCWFIEDFENFADSRMIVLFANEEKVGKILQDFESHKEGNNRWLSVSGRNAPNQNVLSCDTESVKWLLSACEEEGIKTFTLPGGKSYHSQAIDGALPFLKGRVEKLEYKKPNGVFVSSMTGKVLDEITPRYWLSHIREPIEFVSAARAAVKEGAKVFLEIGGHLATSKFVQQSADTEGELIFLPSLSPRSSDLTVMTQSLAQLYVLGKNVDWDGYYSD